MSKYIKEKQTKAKQPKPKLKINATTADGKEIVINEFDLAAINADLVARVHNLEMHVKGIVDAMNAATQEVTGNQFANNQPKQAELKLPKLNNVSKGNLDDGKKFYGYGSDKPNIIE